MVKVQLQSIPEWLPPLQEKTEDGVDPLEPDLPKAGDSEVERPDCDPCVFTTTAAVLGVFLLLLVVVLQWPVLLVLRRSFAVSVRFGTRLGVSSC